MSRNINVTISNERGPQGLPGAAGATGPAGTTSWTGITDRPATFAPSTHKSTHATGGSDALTPADIGAQPAGSYAPASGIAPSAIAGTAVVTSDPRLSDARPTTAASIAAAMETATEEQKETLVPDSINDLTASVIVPDNLQVVRNLYPLPIPMYSGDGRTNPGSGLIHPDVIVFDAPWNGFTHWMAVTPYPQGNAAFENPSIYASNDGITWVVPAGLTNPLKPSPGGGGYHSDPCLVFDAGTLYCIYRTTIGSLNTYYMRSSTNGSTWTAEAVFLNDIAGEGVNSVSPTIVNDESQWVLYFCDSGIVKRRTAPSVTGPWAAPTNVAFLGTFDQFRPTNATTKLVWHLQCFRYSGKTYMLAQIPNDSATFPFEDGKLYLAESLDGISFKFSDKPIFDGPVNFFLRGGPPDPEEWYYRASMVPAFNQGKLLLRMWYSTEWSNMGYAELEIQSQAKEPAFFKGSKIRVRAGNSSAINNTTTLVSDNILRVPIRAGVPTRVGLSIGIDTSNTTTGARFTLIPTSANVDFFKGHWVAGGEGLQPVIFGRQTASNINTTGLVMAISGATQQYHITGEFLVISSTDLSLVFAYAQGTANATNTVIRAGSWIEATEPEL